MNFKLSNFFSPSSHQFFGDAVTCEWWDQIWLNEGFATLLQYSLVDMFEPTWRMYDFMTSFTMHERAFITDSRSTTRPMTNDVNTLTEISNAFDRIAYEKCERAFDRGCHELLS